jgi:hypothetical protein
MLSRNAGDNKALHPAKNSIYTLLQLSKYLTKNK